MSLPAPFVARALNLLYTRFAWGYDAVSWAVSLGEWREWAAAGLPYLTGPRVLELGHGPGHMQALLSERGFAPAGLDLSPQMGRLAAGRLGGQGRLARGRAQSLPFAAGSFDGVLATFPTPYIVAPDTTAEVFRVLRPGGALVVVPEARLGRTGLLAGAIERLYEFTGQRSRNEAASPERLDFWRSAYAPAGFAVAVHSVPVRESAVTVVVARRPAGF